MTIIKSIISEIIHFLDQNINILHLAIYLIVDQIKPFYWLRKSINFSMELYICLILSAMTFISN